MSEEITEKLEDYIRELCNEAYAAGTRGHGLDLPINMSEKIEEILAGDEEKYFAVRFPDFGDTWVTRYRITRGYSLVRKDAGRTTDFYIGTFVTMEDAERQVESYSATLGPEITEITKQEYEES